MTQVKVLYFASAHDITGVTEEMISLTENDVTLATLLDTLVEKYPTLKPLLQIALVAVNMSYVDDDCKDVLLHPGDEIAIIPPVSGG